MSSSSSSTSSSSLDDYYYDDDSGSDKGVGRQAFNCLDPDPICIGRLTPSPYVSYTYDASPADGVVALSV